MTKKAPFKREIADALETKLEAACATLRVWLSDGVEYAQTASMKEELRLLEALVGFVARLPRSEP
jgi:hypothetical protein